MQMFEKGNVSYIAPNHKKWKEFKRFLSCAVQVNELLSHVTATWMVIDVVAEYLQRN